ncbi:MAG: glucose-1-phosphate thymidylyltransferase [Pirellulales bacterium]|nr:glucose-1-phosphate thymidylyltransferase [Pirellulales bacterium]
MTVVLFEDEWVPQLYPVSIGKPAFAITCGGYRLIDLIAEFDASVRWIVRPYLREIQRENFPELAAAPADPGPTLLVNAALAPLASSLDTLDRLVREGRPCIVRAKKRTVVALLPAGASPPAEGSTAEELTLYFKGLEFDALELDLPLLEYPHDIVRYHLLGLAGNLERRLQRGHYREASPGLFVSDEVQLGAHVVTDTRKGPILVDTGANIGPYCYLNGPAYIGAHARVIEHSAIKDGVVLGHTTKIGGEVEASVIEPYTNKQHHGFLGHSYLGSWINLGAGTCNSDLKNTYGEVNMEYQGKRVPTGMQFIGCIVGDYVKSAINTGIFTGKTIGVCSMVYGFVTTNVPSFVNYARLFGQVTETPVEVLIDTQARMFARRNVTQRLCDRQLLRDMYELTRYERQLAGEPLVL